MIRDYAKAISQQNIERASALTTAPGQASEALTATMDGMHAMNVDATVKHTVGYSDGTAGFTLKTVYHWDNGRQFATETQGSARRLSSGWRVLWEPSVIYSGLRPGGRIHEMRTDARPAPRVLARTGKPFMVMQSVNDVVVDPGQSADLGATVRAVARAIAPMAPQVTSEVILAKIAANPGQPVVAVSLRDPDMRVLTTDPGKIRGVTVRKHDKLVMVDRQLDSPLEDGLSNYWQAVRDVTAGWQIVVDQPGQAPERLDSAQGPAAPSIGTSIDPRVQRAAGLAAIEVAQPTTVLTLDARTGGILGMGRNAAATDRGISIDGDYITGSTLSAVFDAVTAYSKASNTPAEELLDRLGLGVVFTVPGASTPERTGASVNDVDFRPGEIRASLLNVGALGVALSRASSGAKTSVAPFVIKGQPTGIHDGKLGTVDDGLSAPILRAMVRTVRAGDASDLTDKKGLRALVGTNGPDGPGWFLGLVDNKVIVIYTEGPKSGTAALQAAQKYLKVR